MSQFITQFQLELIRRWLHEGDSKARDLIAATFWDIQIWRKFGEILQITLPDPEGPLGGPSPKQLQAPWWELTSWWRFFPGLFNKPYPDPSPYLNSEVIMSLINTLAFNVPSNAGGDGDPQPNIADLLGNRGIQLAAAKNLAQKLNTANELINKEIMQLEKYGKV